MPGDVREAAAGPAGLADRVPAPAAAVPRAGVHPGPVTGGRDARAGRAASIAAAAGIGRRTPAGIGRAADSASAVEGRAPARTAAAAGRAADSGAGEVRRATIDRRAAALTITGAAVHARDPGNDPSSRAGVARTARDRPERVDRPAPPEDAGSGAHRRTALGPRVHPAGPVRVHGRSTHPGGAARRTGAAPGARSSPVAVRRRARVRRGSPMPIVGHPVGPGRIDRPAQPRGSRPRHRRRICSRPTRS